MTRSLSDRQTTNDYNTERQTLPKLSTKRPITSSQSGKDTSSIMKMAHQLVSPTIYANNERHAPSKANYRFNSSQ
jgi:hypothetical protein